MDVQTSWETQVSEAYLSTGTTRLNTETLAPAEPGPQEMEGSG